VIELNVFEPVVKWSGSKRSQASEIIKHFPKHIETYYEPFIGGGSMLNALIQSDVSTNNYVCSDINADLINLYIQIRDNPNPIIAHYRQLWKELNIDNDIDRKRAYFESVRKRLNEEHNPLDFMFIMRTTTNGMPRYNSDGEFNNSFHLTRCGIKPRELEQIIRYWHGILKGKNVEFINCSYENIQPTNNNDFCYFDPPYANTKGMYYGTIDYEPFFNYLRNLNCDYVLSFDGKAINNDSGDILDSTYTVPEDVYTKHIYLNSGKSRFRMLNKTSNNTNVLESLYIKRGGEKSNE
jgi:DNA adenine methylase